MHLTNTNFDFISFTFSILHHKREGIDSKLDIMSRSLKGKISCRLQKYKKDDRKFYKNNYRFKIKNKDRTEFTFLISTNPLRKKGRFSKRETNYMRLEFNPNNAGVKLVKKIRKILKELIGKAGIKEMAATCSVTRIDACVDVSRDVSNLHPYFPRCKKMKTFVDEASKEITGFSLGSGKSQIRITIYNKKKQLEGKDKGKVMINGFLYRLEIRVRNLDCNLLNINPLKIIDKLSEVVFFNSGILNEEKFSSRFKSDVQEHGVNRAILNLSRKDRQKYLRILKNKYVEKNVFDINGINVDTFLDPIEPLLY